MNIDDRPRDLRANSHILGKFQMAITLQRVNRSTSCLVLGWGFRGRLIERRHFRLDQTKMAAGGYLGKLQMAKLLKHIIGFTMYVHRPYFALGL